MSFKCSIRDEAWEFDHIPIAENEHIVSMLVGYNTDSGANVFVQAALTPYLDGEPEYSFWILQRDPYTGHEQHFLSGIDVSRFIDKSDRERILTVVLAATKELLETKRPKRVYRCNNDVAPPERALEKHYAVSRVFRDAGYEVTQSDDWYGKRVWLAELAEIAKNSRDAGL